MSGRPAPVPLTGADCFLRAFDAETRRVNGASHLSQLVLRLGPGFDPGRLKAVLDDFVRANPIVRAPIRRPFGIGAPEYRIDRSADSRLPPVHVHEGKLPPGVTGLGDVVPLPAVFRDRLNDTFSARRGELLQVDAVQYEGGNAGTDLALTWLHLLFDGSGSENFVRLLDDCARGAKQPHDLPAGEWETTRVDGTAGERGAKARAWQAHVEGFAVNAPHSLTGPSRQVAQALTAPVYTLDPDASARVVERAKERAGFLTPMLFYLAASVRAHLAVFDRRGTDPGSFVVPLPVNLRPKGAEGAVFRTRVSMMWFQVLPDVARDLDALVADLKRQRRDMIKGGAIENGVAAMDYARYAPSRVYATMARRSFGGELCSFFFAFTGDFLPGLESFIGAPVLNGFHVPSVPASPGSGAIMSLREGRLNIAHVHQAGALDEAELACFRDQLLADLLGHGQGSLA